MYINSLLGGDPPPLFLIFPKKMEDVCKNSKICPPLTLPSHTRARLLVSVVVGMQSDTHLMDPVLKVSFFSDLMGGFRLFWTILG